MDALQTSLVTGQFLSFWKENSMSYRLPVTVVTLLMVLGLLAGCVAPAAPTVAPTQAPVAPTALPAGAPKYGGVFKAAFSAAPPTLDPMISMAGATCWITQYIFETLIAFGEDYTFTPVLAEKWDVSPDGKTYTFYLRQGIKFHNGKEMTSEDVIASTKRFLEVNPRKAQFTLLQSYEAKDKYTVVFRLSSPSGAFLDAIAYPVAIMAIMPKEIIEGKKSGDLKTEELIGTGPYQQVEAKLDQFVTLKRFEGYKALPGEPSGLGGARIPYFDEIQLIFVPELGARMAGIETGTYDWVQAIPATEYDLLKAKPNVRPYFTSPIDWSIYILFNHANKFSSDVKFRQAVLAALDLDAVSMAITGGRKEFYRLNPSIWVPEGPWYIADDPLAKQLYNQKNPEKAKQLLKEAGYGGEEIIMVTNRDYDWMYKMIVAVADQLKKNAGMNVKVEVLDWPGQRAKWEEKTTWHMSTTGYLSQVIFAPDALASFWSSKSTSSERGFYANPDMDKAFDEAANAVTYEQRKEAFKKVQRIFYETLPNIKVTETFAIEAIRSDIKGHKAWYRASRFWSVWR
jgi:peptide/nickel transport system substrate-binding protein